MSFLIQSINKQRSDRNHAQNSKQRNYPIENGENSDDHRTLILKNILETLTIKLK